MCAGTQVGKLLNTVTAALHLRRKRWTFAQTAARSVLLTDSAEGVLV